MGGAGPAESLNLGHPATPPSEEGGYSNAARDRNRAAVREGTRESGSFAQVIAEQRDEKRPEPVQSLHLDYPPLAHAIVLVLQRAGQAPLLQVDSCERGGLSTGSGTGGVAAPAEHRLPTESGQVPSVILRGPPAWLRLQAGLLKNAGMPELRGE